MATPPLTWLQQMSLRVSLQGKVGWHVWRFWLKSLFYWQYFPAAFFYSLRRDRAERSEVPTTAPAVITPGSLLAISDRGATVECQFEQATLTIDFLQADFLRLTWQPGLAPIPYAIATSEWAAPPIQRVPTDNGWIVMSARLHLTIGTDGSLTFRDPTSPDPTQRLIRQEQPPQRQGDRWIHRAPLRSTERIYGLGEQATALNLRATGQPYHLWNSDPGGRYRPGTEPLYLCIPVYLGLHEGGSYLIFYENSFPAQFQFETEATADFTGGSLRYYLAIGDPPTLLDRYTQLTGRAPLPARWTFGYHQSRWGYHSEATLRQEVMAFQTHNLPLSAVHLDIDCQVAHRPFTLDPDRFPHLSGFIQELGQAGIRLVAINNPGIKVSRHSNLFLEGKLLNAFCTYPTGELVIAPVWAGRKVFPDFTQPTVRAWWSRQYAYLLDVGIAGFWHDMNEPAVFVSWGDPSLPKVARHQFEGRGGDHREAHNLYALLEARSAYEYLRQARPQQRPFIVSRSGWAGLQRYAWNWTGDTASTWESLRQTIATLIGLGLSGLAFSGPDIGGFQGNPTAELYLRWFQMATFLPFYRTHSAISDLPRAPWRYGEPYLTILRRFLHLRYQLIPYLYTLAWETSQTGAPLVRPLFWQDWSHTDLWEIEDAFCLGDALCLYPIVTPGPADRSVYLPPGDWYHFWDDAKMQGGTAIVLKTTLEQIPLFVKAGTVLPLEMEAASTEPRLILHLYPLPAGEQESFLYSDAGEGDGASRIDRFRLQRSDQLLEVHWESEGDYPFPYAEVQIQVHGGEIRQAWIDGTDWKLEENGDRQFLRSSRFQRAQFHLT